ncbi:MAG: glycoside hydrolase, partial [Acidobacteriota bacterium]|nr:glycoside hydrolase [Acidobacteriota bacterium]
MRKSGLFLLLLAALVPLLSQTPRDPLEAGFADPPKEARLRCYWWWLNGNTDEAAITRDLEAMKDKGYAGAILVDANGSEQNGNRAVPAGPMFGTPRWRELYRHALQEAARLDLELSLNIESGWNLGGPTVQPEHSTKLLTWSRAHAEGPREVRLQLEQPPAKSGFYRDIAVLAYPLRHGAPLPPRPIRDLAVKSAAREMGMSAPRTLPLLEDIPAEPGEEDARAADVRDVTSAMQPGGAFTWTAPAGEWEILRIGYMASGARVSTSSGQWQGLVIDYLDPSEFARYWKEHLDPLMQDARPYLGKSLRYLVTDSWELGGINWTPRFREEFRARRGYDVLPWLPVVAGRILDSRDTSNRFLNDFRRTVGDLVIAGHYRPFAEAAARYGLGIHPESGGPHGAPIDALETLGVSTLPQMEFWARSRTHRVRDDERFFVKQGSSAAHTYGKTLTAAEGFTSIGPQWEESLWDNLKPTFDQAICAGLNRLIWHTFTSSPQSAGVPGQEYFAGTHMNPNVTWWSKAGAFTGYINRVQFLMQQGVPVSDVLVYYGDQVPNFVQWKGSDPAGVLPGYDYDVIDERALTQRVHARSGRLELPEGTSYAVLVLPPRDSISPAALAKVRELVLAGAAVAGPRPVRTTGIGDDAAVRRVAGEIWGRCGATARDMLRARRIPPDFEAPADTDYVHRRSGATDIYFVRNARPEARRIDATFRVKDRAPELWHAETGRIEAAGIYQATPDGRTLLPLWLEPYGSVAVVFRGAPAVHAVSVSPDTAEVKIAGAR